MVVKKVLLLSICIIGSYFLNAQNKIKFEPISSTTESILPKPEGLVYQGKYTSSTEVFEDNGTYYMIINDLVGGWPCEKINVTLASSTDLEHWKWLERPLFSSEDLPFKLTKPNGFATSIVKDTNGTYLLYMDVLDNDKNIGIGLATSKSLSGPWHIHDEMILKPNKDVWSTFSMAGADVIFYHGKYLMYYMGVPNAITNGETSVCMAESNDGITWDCLKNPVLTKSDKNDFDSHKVGVPKIIKDGNELLMLYRSDNGNGTWGGDSAYGMAKSKDGKTWDRIQKEPVLHENDVDNWNTIWACGLIKVGNTYHLFLEYDGPPVYDTRINHATYKLND